MADDRKGNGLRIADASFLIANGVRIDIPRLNVPKGGLLVVAGPNGGGKTSLASFLCGLRRERPSHDIRTPTMCWQQPELIPGTVFDNLDIVRGGRNSRWPPTTVLTLR